MSEVDPNQVNDDADGTTNGAENTDQAQVAQESPAENKKNQRAFTIKSVLFGVIGLVFTICFTAYGELVLHQTAFVANHLPPGPIFLVVALALVWNPMWHSRIVYWSVAAACTILSAFYCCCVLDHSILYSWHVLILAVFALFSLGPVWSFCKARWILSGRELLVALLIIFGGCWTSGAGLNYHFATTQVNVWGIYENSDQMQRAHTLEYIPEHLWPAGGLNHIGDNAEEKKRVYDSFRTGSAEQGLGNQVPWDAWMPSVLIHWLPLFFLFSLCTIALSLIVHRQWAHHEQLAYPIAEIGGTLFKRDKRILPAIFYDKKFWTAALLVILFHGIRYVHAWFPNNAPDISTSTYFKFYLDIFPDLKKSGLFNIHWFNFFFSIIGISYFLSREISLTIGLAPFLLAIFGAQMYAYSGETVSGGDSAIMRAGAYFAYAAVILYTGRNYYWSIFKKAVCFQPASDFERDGVFASRVLIIAFAALILLLNISFELDLVIAILFCLTGLLMMLVFTRVICETGIPYLQSAWGPHSLLISAMGVSAIGSAPVVLLYYISTMMFCDPKEALMPYISNGFKMAEGYKLKLKKIFIVTAVIIALSVVLSIGNRLYQQYNLGGHKLNYPWADVNVPQFTLSNATRDLNTLEDIGQKTAPGVDNGLGFLKRLSLINPSSSTIGFFLFGAAGVCGFFFLRFRFIGFPLHPVLFLIWGVGPNVRTFYSFLIGWFIREAIVRFGGGQIYQNCKPFFIGLIVGELFMGVFGVGVGYIYHIFTDFEERPPGFKVILG
ncbi:MAG: hypothetical protein HRU15_14050 [Planctomycetes bacterium]|nr:hypothetical protein [Planctomycetota bacterium]